MVAQLALRTLFATVAVLLVLSAPTASAQDELQPVLDSLGPCVGSISNYNPLLNPNIECGSLPPCSGSQLGVPPACVSAPPCASGQIGLAPVCVADPRANAPCPYPYQGSNGVCYDVWGLWRECQNLSWCVTVANPCPPDRIGIVVCYAASRCPAGYSGGLVVCVNSPAVQSLSDYVNYLVSCVGNYHPLLNPELLQCGVQPPGVPSLAPDTVIEEGPPPITRSTSATFKFRSSQPASSFDCRLDSGSWIGCSSPKAYSGLANGTHVFQVRAKNAIGQADQSPASHTWRVDTIPPDTTITSGPPSFSNSPTAEFAFSSNEADVTFECQLDSGAWEPCVSPKRYVDLAETAHTFRVRGTDAAGNLETTPATRTWTIDLTPPNTTITAGPSGTVWSQSATFSFSSSEVGTFECSLDGAAFSACSTPKSYSGLSEGGHTFDVRAVDRAGNRDSSPARRSWTVTLRPSIALSGSLKNAAEAGGALVESDYDLVVNANDGSSGVTSIEISVDGVEQDFVDRACSSGGCSLQRSWTFPNGDFPGGQHAVQVTARNGGGFARSQSLSVTTNPPDRDENGPEDDVGDPGGSGGGPESEAQDDALEPEARMRWPDTFAGLWQVAEGRVFVAFTQNASENVAELQQDFPSAGDLVPVTLPRSLAELEGLQDLMIADRDGLAPDALLPLPERYDLGIDVTQNVVYAVVEDLDPRVQLAFMSRYGAAVQVRQGPLFEPERCTRANCKYQLRGGLRIANSAGALCSSGFVARGPNGGLNLLSAAHCGGTTSDVGSARYHGDEQYGTVLDQQFRDRVDAERHSIDTPFTAAGIILVDGTERARPIQSISRWDEVRVGRRVCKSGYRSGKTCGKIRDKHFSPDDPDDRWVPGMKRFVKTTYCGRPGDSGGGVFRDRRAFGVHSGGSPGSCQQAGDFSAFSHIEYISNALNVTVVTQP